jgi:rod shape-determining protein MreC
VKDRSRFTYRLVAPLPGLVQRFTFLGLVIAALTLMLIAKADVAMIERLRAQVTDSVAPIIDVMSRPVVMANEVIVRVGSLVTVY